MTLNNLPLISQQNVHGIGQYLDEKKLSIHTNDLRNQKKEPLHRLLINTPVLLDDLKLAIEKGQSRRTGKTLHKLKTEIGHLCVDSLFQEIQNLETSTLLVATAPYIHRISRLNMSIERLLKEVSKVPGARP